MSYIPCPNTKLSKFGLPTIEYAQISKYKFFSDYRYCVQFYTVPKGQNKLLLLINR